MLCYLVFQRGHIYCRDYLLLLSTFVALVTRLKYLTINKAPLDKGAQRGTNLIDVFLFTVP